MREFGRNACCRLNSLKFPHVLPETRPLQYAEEEGGTGITVWATGFSLAQTGFSLAQSVASECVFSTAPRFFAPIWRTDAVHVFGRKIHVVDIVCKKIRPCCTACHGPPTTFSPPRFFSLSKAHTALWCAYLAGGVNTRAAVSWFYN